MLSLRCAPHGSKDASLEGTSLLLMNLTSKGVERPSSYAREAYSLGNGSSAQLRVRTPRPPFEADAQLTGHRTA